MAWFVHEVLDVMYGCEYFWNLWRLLYEINFNDSISQQKETKNQEIINTKNLWKFDAKLMNSLCV